MMGGCLMGAARGPCAAAERVCGGSRSPAAPRIGGVGGGGGMGGEGGGGAGGKRKREEEGWEGDS
jgi:hypothetical protein